MTAEAGRKPNSVPAGVSVGAVIYLTPLWVQVWISSDNYCEPYPKTGPFKNIVFWPCLYCSAK